MFLSSTPSNVFIIAPSALPCTSEGALESALLYSCFNGQDFASLWTSMHLYGPLRIPLRASSSPPQIHTHVKSTILFLGEIFVV